MWHLAFSSWHLAALLLTVISMVMGAAAYYFANDEHHGSSTTSALDEHPDESNDALNQGDSGPKTCQGDDDEPKQTDEERMLNEIEKQRALIGTSPVDSFQEMIRRFPHQKKLGQLEFKCHILVEKRRLAEELSKFEKEFGTLYSEPCLLCLDNIHVHATARLKSSFYCCGGFICKTCTLGIGESELGFGGKCPLCREPIVYNMTTAIQAARLIALAERGVSWAQTSAGVGMIHGYEGFEQREKTGLQWLKKAATENFPGALYCLSDLYRDGLPSLLRRSQEKANELLKRAANLGFSRANSELALYYFTGGINGFEKDHSEAYFRASVSLALDESNPQASMVLGSLNYEGHVDIIPERSPYLACYYLNISATANEDRSRSSCFLYSQLLKILSEYLHGDCIEIPEFNVMPAVFFWLRKSRDMGYVNAFNVLKEWESLGQRRCGHCRKEAQSGEKFKQCSKCNAQWYCSKECQVGAWRAGHRKDCKRAGILDFEDYLNAD